MIFVFGLESFPINHVSMATNTSAMLLLHPSRIFFRSSRDLLAKQRWRLSQNVFFILQASLFSFNPILNWSWHRCVCAKIFSLSLFCCPCASGPIRRRVYTRHTPSPISYCFDFLKLHPLLLFLLLSFQINAIFLFSSVTYLLSFLMSRGRLSHS